MESTKEFVSYLEAAAKEKFSSIVEEYELARPAAVKELLRGHRFLDEHLARVSARSGVTPELEQHICTARANVENAFQEALARIRGD